jgi:arylsulfatase A-like enzyme
MTARGPNILVFMTDQEQAAVTMPGHPCRTPHLDRFAAEGVRFGSAWTPMAHCCPARASFMTGLYPSQHGVHNNVLNETAMRTGLRPGVQTFAERLAEGGYDLYYAGKWHVSADERPRNRGWTELECSSIAGRDYHGVRREAWLKRDPELGRTTRAPGEVLRPGWGSYRLYGTGDEQADRDWAAVHSACDRLWSLKGSRKPWCVYVGTNAPHDPFVVPAKYASMYDPALVRLPASYRDDLADKPGLYRRMRRLWDQLGEDEVRASIAHYWGFCTLADEMFGRVLATLDEIGATEDTLVLFVSDHGEHCGAHGLYLKGLSTFDEGYHVPAVVRWPGRGARPGTTVDDLVSLIDFAPTFLEAAGLPPLDRCAGRSLVPFLRGQRPEGWREDVYAQCNGVEVYCTRRMVRTARHKLVYTPVDVDELYDLETDPFEMRNLADEPAAAAVKARLYRRMWQYAYDTEDIIFNPYASVATADYGPAVLNGSRVSRGGS